LGADHVIDPTDGDLMTAVAGALGDPPSLVVECTGVPGLIGDAMVQAAVDGRVVVVGICLVSDSFFPWFGIQKELDVRFSVFYGAEDFVDTLAGLEDGLVDPAGLVTETTDLDALPDRFARMVASPDAGKVVLLP
jgi:(R,R)-butanediol dehydrogenase/meso-butanediol dehydrogenase/diacetyl reductase